MKVLHVCETVKGGLASYLNELIPAQQDKFGAENIRLLVPDAHADFLKGIEPSSVQVFSRASRKSGLIKLAKSYIKMMREERPDIVHAHSTFSGVVIRVLRPFFPKTPIIYCPHGWAMDMEQPPLRKAIIKTVEWGLSFFCEKIICISEYERQIALDTGISKNKCVTIYNGITSDPPTFTPVTWHDDKRLKVLFIGRFDRQKGIDVLLEAYAPIQDRISLKLIGDAVSGDESINMNEYAFADRLGWLDMSEIASWLDQCDIIVVPSRWEGFGLVAIEAMRMSRPVLASKVGGLGEILEDGVSGIYVPPNDPTSLRAATEKVDKKTLKTMGEAARERFIACFQSEQMIEKISSLYKNSL